MEILIGYLQSKRTAEEFHERLYGEGGTADRIMSLLAQGQNRLTDPDTSDEDIQEVSSEVIALHEVLTNYCAVVEGLDYEAERLRVASLPLFN